MAHSRANPRADSRGCPGAARGFFSELGKRKCASDPPLLDLRFRFNLQLGVEAGVATQVRPLRAESKAGARLFDNIPHAQKYVLLYCKERILILTSAAETAEFEQRWSRHWELC